MREKLRSFVLHRANVDAMLCYAQNGNNKNNVRRSRGSDLNKISASKRGGFNDTEEHECVKRQLRRQAAFKERKIKEPCFTGEADESGMWELGSSSQALRQKSSLAQARGARKLL